MRPARTLNPRTLTRLLAVVAAAAVVILAAPWFVRATLRLLGEPAAFLVLQPAVSLLIIGGLLLTGYTYRDRIAELEADKERADREHAQDIADLTAALAEATATLADARVVIPLRPVAGPTVVPMQRDGHLPLSSEEWDAIQRETEWPS